MRPVTAEYGVSQGFASMPTRGVVGNINAPSSTVEYWVGRYGNYQADGHAGIDFRCPVGTPVHAMGAGTVLWADWGYNLPGVGPIRKWLFYATFPGKLLVIKHWWGIGAYAHLSAFKVKAGDVVEEGQLVALSGNTGGVDPHLHVEALVDLTYRTGGGLIYGRTDPAKYFGTITPQGETEEDELDKYQDAALAAVYGTVNRAPGAGLLASQGDVNIILARVGTLENLLLEVLGKQRTPTATLVKSTEGDTVFAWDEGTGYRALEYSEFGALMAAGAELREVEQSTIDDALSGQAARAAKGAAL